MNLQWQKFLTKHGAVIENNHIISFNNSKNRFQSLEETSLCELSSLGVIQVCGEDALPFLHGQFTNDLNNVSTEHCQLSSYCNHKGRMLSIFNIHKKEEDYFIILPRDVLDQTISKLNLYKLRAKVELLDRSDELVLFGIVGPGSRSILKELNLIAPSYIHQSIHINDTTLLRLQSESYRVLCISTPSSAINLLENIINKVTFSTIDFWNLHDIYSGIPQVTANNIEAFIPQMTNLDLIDGVSFNKGCYPGQEIVARTHYLGKPNRRMYRVIITDENKVEPGMKIFSPEDEKQPVGRIVLAQKITACSSSALVVMRTDKVDNMNLALNSVDGPKVSMESLPYSLDENIG